MRYVIASTLIVAISLMAVAQEKPVKGGRVPNGWGKLLKLTPAQTTKLRELDAKARAEITKLEEQIRQVRAKLRSDQLAVLTPEQRKSLVGEVDEPVTKKKKK